MAEMENAHRLVLFVQVSLKEVAHVSPVRSAFNHREGIAISTVTYNDNGEVRPIIYRLSVAEMVVPYGAPEHPHTRKFAFDSGEYGMGQMANELSLGCDCVGQIHYLVSLVTLTIRNSSHKVRMNSRVRTLVSTAAPPSSRTPSASTRRTPASCGSTPTTAQVAVGRPCVAVAL